MILMGRVSGLFGVKGWLKIYSHAAPREGILDYKVWYLMRDGNWQPFRVAAGQRQGKSVVAHLEGYDDRDQATSLLGSDIAIRREQLPALADGEYYWSDLEGLRVVNLQGIELGVVSYLFETGANDVLVVKGERERLIPYTLGMAVKSIDLQDGLLTVDWDPDF
ncbi:MAG: ribosome maturation factor RimM [Candidatus Thiodiazotropha sp.]|jgi:16S rRNA processing protein RimM